MENSTEYVFYIRFNGQWGLPVQYLIPKNATLAAYDESFSFVYLCIFLSSIVLDKEKKKNI